MAKIQTQDAQAMDSLFASELQRKGVKVASENIQAFEDHKEYTSLLQDVLGEDNKQSWSPNDVLLD